MRALLLSLVLSPVFITVRAEQEAPAVKPIATEASPTYALKPGDSLNKIAKAFGCTTNSILSVNPGLNPATMRVGQVITLPDESAKTRYPVKATESDRLLKKGLQKADVESRLHTLGASTTEMEVVSTSGEAPVFWAIPGRCECLSPTYDNEGTLISLFVLRDTDQAKSLRHSYTTETYLLPATGPVLSGSEIDFSKWNVTADGLGETRTGSVMIAGKSLSARIETTSKGNGVLLLRNLSLRVFDDHDDEVIYKDGWLTVSISGTEPTALIFSGVIRLTGDKQHVEEEHPIHAVYRYRPDSDDFVKVRAIAFWEYAEMKK